MNSRLELRIVGDTHGDFDDVDRAFLEGGVQDLAVFVGDFGDENLREVERVAAVAAPKVVILGNHEAWRASRGAPLDTLERMSAALGDADLGYRARRVGGYAIVGGRPFSWGGPWGPFTDLWERLYGIRTAAESAARIVATADAATEGRDGDDVPVVLVAHNGPTGLGSDRAAPYGRDFRTPSSDFGDPDLRLALDTIRTTRAVPLCIAGHMHDRLRGGGVRRRTAALGGTLHVNAAVVPRHRREEGRTLRHFVHVIVEGAEVALIEDEWVDDAGRIARVEALPRLAVAPPPETPPA